MSLKNGLRLMGKNKNAKKFDPKGHARSMKKSSKIKKNKNKISKFQKYKKRS